MSDQEFEQLKEKIAQLMKELAELHDIYRRQTGRRYKPL